MLNLDMNSEKTKYNVHESLLLVVYTEYFIEQFIAFV